jgi:ferredoxin
MGDKAIKLGGKRKSVFLDKVKEILLPEGGNLNLCLTCGACSSGCPATGLEGMDPRKFLRMAALGLDEEILSSPWVWMCTMCQRCIYVCPMKIDIPQLVFNARPAGRAKSGPRVSWGPATWPCATKPAVPWALPRGFSVRGGGRAGRVPGGPARIRRNAGAHRQRGAEFFLNQNSREPVTEPDEWCRYGRSCTLAGADWTYGTKGWAVKTTACSWPMTKTGKHMVRVKRRRRMPWGARFGSTPSEGTNFSVRAGLKKFNVSHKFEVKSIIRILCQVDPGGQAQGQFRLEQGAENQVHRPGSLPDRAQILSATRLPRTCGSWSSPWSVKKTSSI